MGQLGRVVWVMGLRVMWGVGAGVVEWFMRGGMGDRNWWAIGGLGVAVDRFGAVMGVGTVGCMMSKRMMN